MFLSEAALHTRVTGDEVMTEQLLGLVALAHLSNVVIRIVRFAAATPVAGTLSAFVLEKTFDAVIVAWRRGLGGQGHPRLCGRRGYRARIRVKRCRRSLAGAGGMVGMRAAMIWSGRTSSAPSGVMPTVSAQG